MHNLVHHLVNILLARFTAIRMQNFNVQRAEDSDENDLLHGDHGGRTVVPGNFGIFLREEGKGGRKSGEVLVRSGLAFFVPALTSDLIRSMPPRPFQPQIFPARRLQLTGRARGGGPRLDIHGTNRRGAGGEERFATRVKIDAQCLAAARRRLPTRLPAGDAASARERA